jgi:ATP-dependent Lon protease
LDILKNIKNNYQYPIKVTIDDIKNNYFKDKPEVRVKKIGQTSCVARINGMYATTLGTGGTLPIQAKFFPCSTFLELKLTGLQQEVMRESMHLSLTVAWNLTSLEKQIELRQKYDNKQNCCGINIHTGDGAVSKDGPSAGCAITCVLYSLFNQIPIKPEFGVTGEILIDNTIGAIGGLSHKILGSLKSNVTSFVFPKDNQKEFDEFMEKYKETDLLKGIQFYPVSTVEEVLNLLLDK